MRRLIGSLLVVTPLLFPACAAHEEEPPPYPSVASEPIAPGGPDSAGDPAASSGPASLTSGPIEQAAWQPPVLAKRSAGCGTSRPAASGTTYTTPSGRTFHVWGPASYDPQKAYPVALVYHGWKVDGRAFQGWFEMEKYVSNQAFVVYPDASGGLWDLSGQSDLVFFDEMTKMLEGTYCTDPSRVLGFGFSYGGHFMSHLGCERAGHVKALVIGAAGGEGKIEGCGRLPVLYTHRTKDLDEVISGAYASAARWAKRNGCTTEIATVDAQMNCSTHVKCSAPGSVTFCEDTFFDPGWPAAWNHTVRDTYRAHAWSWFAALP